jgi:hypothetical protein
VDSGLFDHANSFTAVPLARHASQGKTSVLIVEEARELLDRIPLVRTTGGATTQGPGGLSAAIRGPVARSRAYRGDGL